jgi:hypothetical protein
VHRRVQFPEDPQASVQSSVEAMRRQSESDREHMLMLKNAIECIYVNQHQQMSDFTAITQRTDTLAGTMERDRTMARTELQRMQHEIAIRINSAVDMELQAFVSEVAQFKAEFEASQAQAMQVQAYVEKLDEDRPVEGVALVESFRLLHADLEALKANLNVFGQKTDGKIAAAQGGRAGHACRRGRRAQRHVPRARDNQGLERDCLHQIRVRPS